MIVVTPHPLRRIVRALVDMLWHSTIAGLGPAIIWILKNPPYFSPALAIGAPAAAVAVASLLKSWGSRPIELTWDREGIHYSKGDEIVSIPWAEYEGHRRTWNYLPPRIKVLRRGKRAVIIDVPMFEEADRQAFLDELGVHEAALPNTRLKLTARVD